MNNDTYRQVGYIQKTHGKKGDLRVHTETDALLEELLNTTVVFLDIDGLKMPFFVEKITAKNTVLLKLEDIDSMEEAKKMTNQPVYMRTADFQQQHDLITPGAFAHLHGFIIEDETLGKIGPIVDVLELPEQIMAVVDYEAQNKEVMIPLNDTFMQDVDEVDGIIVLDLPEGLLDI